jgi:uncharacterized repeat protein (TIGR04076 family)
LTKVKIEVIKKFSPSDIVGNEVIRPKSGQAIEPCYLNVGDEFEVDESGNMPEGFCHHAWFGIYKNVSILAYGGRFEDWTGDCIYNACPDGIRPVIFKLTPL